MQNLNTGNISFSTTLRGGALVGKSIFAVSMAAAFIVGGFFAPQYALAAAGVSPATGGAGVSIDTTSAGVTPTFTTLSGPAISEGAAGDINVGTHTITLPSGWEFDTGSNITISKFGDIVLDSTTVTPSPTSFSFVVSSESNSPSVVGFSNLKVRPTGTTPSTDKMTHSGAGIVGVVDGSTNFGTLSTVAGTVTKLAFATQPGDAVYGSVLSPQPVVKTQDQFGNNSVSGLASNLNVTLSLTTGTGLLEGTNPIDIGTSAGNGTATFTGLTVDEVGTKGLTASATGPASDVSATFDITPKTLTATITADSKTYDGNNSATFTNPTPVGAAFSDVLTLSGGSATFADANVSTNKTVTATGLILAGTNAGNYTYDGTATGAADITPKPITVTADTLQAKVYGDADPVAFTYTADTLINPDVFTGALSRVAGEDVNTYAYTLGTLANGLDNYALTLAPATFEITQKPLTVTATGINKEYDQTTNATVTLSSVDEEVGDNLVYDYTSALFLDKTAVNGKTVNVSGISISGPKSGNYALQNTAAATTANITKKPITATINLDNKTYNGNTNAVYSSTNPRVANGVIADDVVVVENTGSKAFVDKHVGVGKTVNATGLTLSGTDAGNYQFDGTGTGIATISPRPITVTATTDSRTYNGTDVSTSIPTHATLQGSDTAGFSQKFDNKNVGTGKTLTPSGVVIDGNPILEGSNYAVTFEVVSTGVITVKDINVTAQPDTKTYDGTTSSNEAPVVGALEFGDSVGTPPTQSYDTEDVGTEKTLTPSGLVIDDGFGGANYNVTYVNDLTGVIEAKILTVTGATTNSKTYDGNTTATVDFTFAELVGVVGVEDVSLDSSGYSAEYDDKNVDTEKTVTVSGLILDGAGASNYSLTQPVLEDGVITPRTLVVTADGTTKVYDSTLDATDIVTLSDDRVLLDDLTLTHTAAFITKDVANGKDINVTGIAITGGDDAGNYILGNTETDATADITPAPLTATITAADKVYDGTDVATITGRTPGGVFGTDEITLNGGAATFNNENVANGKLVSAIGITHTGADALNYSYDGAATGDADITPLGITGSFTADNKVYDGTTDAEVLTRSLTGVLPQDVGNVILTGGTAEFADPNVDDDIVVTEMVAMELTGLASGNYELTSVDTTTANITKAPLTITAENKSKIYGDTNPALTASYVGFVGGEDASVLDTSVVLGTLADETSVVGTYPITASGAADANYEITHINGTLTVNPAPITITPDSEQGKIYGDSDLELTYTASGFKNGEDKSIFTGALERDEGEDADVYDITLGTLDVGGNYFVDSFFDVTYTIEQRPLIVTAVTDTKTYDGNTTSDGTPTIIGELQFGQSSGFTQSYDNENVGDTKTLTASGVVNDGNGGNNYIYDFLNTAVGEITALEIIITPNAGQSKVFGEDEPVAFTFTNVPALIDGAFTGGLSRAEGENVGTYEYELGSLTAGDNYSLTLETETFAITKATPVITWTNPADITYGTALSGTQLNATADVGGVFVYTPVSGTVLNAGVGQILSVAFTPTNTANYNSVEETALITITPATLTVTAENKAKEYLEADPALTYTPSGLVNNDTNTVFTGALVRESGELGGTYAITQGTLLAGDNYVITFNDGTFTITDSINPAVVSHTPSLNALNISPTTAIVVTFSEAVVVDSGDVSFSPTISGGFTISDSGTSVVTITPNDPLEDNTTYTITLDGVADLNTNVLPAYSNIKFTTATIYSINLNANASGWNLISLPVVPSNTAIAAVLGSAVDNIDAVWTYDPINPNAVNGWLVFVPGNPEGTNNLTLMTTGFGYWVSVTGGANLSGSGTLLIAGPTPPPSRSLQAGWNLIGYYQLPNEDNSIPANAFASLDGSYMEPWGFDNAEGSFFRPVTTINPGDAFWIFLLNAKPYSLGEYAE